jgi:hypothetical protein
MTGKGREMLHAAAGGKVLASRRSRRTLWPKHRSLLGKTPKASYKPVWIKTNKPGAARAR